MSIQNELFTTYDLNLSAVLLAKGLVLEEVKKNPKGKSLFYFQKSKKLGKLIDEYWREEIKIKPQDLFNSLKSIKNRIYSNY